MQINTSEPSGSDSFIRNWKHAIQTDTIIITSTIPIKTDCLKFFLKAVKNSSKTKHGCSRMNFLIT